MWLTICFHVVSSPSLPVVAVWVPSIGEASSCEGVITGTA